MLRLHDLSIVDPEITAAGAEACAPAPFLVDWFFAQADEPMLIIDADTDAIVEANPAAAALLRSPSESLIGRTLASAFTATGAGVIAACVSVVKAVGSAVTASVRTRNGGFDLQLRLSLCRTPAAAYLLVRLEPTHPQNTTGNPAPHSTVCRALDAAHFGFVMTDADLRIEYANQGFIELIGGPTRAGDLVTKWLRLTHTDLFALTTQRALRQAMTRLTAQLRTVRSRRRVEVYAVAVPDTHACCWGFCIYEAARLN